MTIEKLASILEVAGSTNPSLSTLSELTDFENQAGFSLPGDYKAFCQVFGFGQFGEHMKIYCPNIGIHKKSLASMKLAFMLAKEEFGDIESAAEIEDLLNSCFVFGTNPNSQDIVWDLRTYSELDDSYDIYLIPLDPLDEVFFLERKFLDFIYEFCIGENGYNRLPEHIHPCEGTIFPRFLRYDITDKELW